MKKSIILFLLLFISASCFSQAKDIKKLYKLFEEKEWLEYDQKRSALITEFTYDFKPIFRYSGVLDDDKFYVYYRTGDDFALKKANMTNYNLNQEKLILSYMHCKKSVELKESINYESNLQILRGSYYLVLLGLNNANSNSDYGKVLEELNITDKSMLSLMSEMDSLAISFFNSQMGKTSQSLLDLKAKLNTSKFLSVIDSYIQEKEENEAIESKDLKTIVLVLNKYPSSMRRKELLIYHDEFYFAYASKTGTVEVFRAYKKDIPNGKYSNEVDIKIEALFFGQAINSNDIEFIKKVLTAYPNNQNVSQVKYHLEEFEFVVASKSGIVGYENFIRQYPNSVFSTKAKDAILVVLIENAIVENNVPLLKTVILNNPKHPKIEEIKAIVLDADNRAKNTTQYSGNYFEGKAIFQYYVNEQGNRVLNGTFKFQQDYYDYDSYDLKLDFLDIINFPYIKNPYHGGVANEDSYSNVNSLIHFLGYAVLGEFTGNYVHGKKNGTWKYENYNKHTYNKEVLTLELRHDTLVSAKYSVTNTKYTLPFSNCIACANFQTSINQYGYNGPYKFVSNSDVVSGNYLNGMAHGTWNKFVKYYDPSDPEEEEFNWDSESFAADIAIEYSMGKIVSKVIRNQETGQIVTGNE